MMPKARTWAVMGLFCAAGLFCAQPLSATPAADEAAVTKTLTYTLGPLRISGLMEAMSGPVLQQPMQSLPEAAGTIWVKSFKVSVLNGMSQPDDSLEFLCHAWLTSRGASARDERLLTVSQGMDEMKFPPGFATRLPNLADATVMAQALNDNNATARDISYRVTVRYIADADAARLKLKHLRTITAAIDAGDAVQTFIANTTIGGENKKICADKGASFLVPPGRHVYLTRLNLNHGLSQGGSIHAIKLHLHAYGESMRLLDLTDNKTVWEGKAQNAKGKALILHVDDYNSAAGLKLTPGHLYGVEATYDNPTTEPVEAMAVLRLYLAD